MFARPPWPAGVGWARIDGGIGLELARLLAADGYRLVRGARDAPKLESVAHDLSTAPAATTSQPHLIIAQDLAAPDGVDRVMAQ